MTMDRLKPIRNVAIILALGAAVYFLPQGGRAATTFAAILSVGFAAGIAFFAGRMYLEHRVAIYGLGDRHRALLYAAVAVGLVTIAAQPRMFQSSVGEIAWFAILAGVAYALFHVYRFSRTY
jgi:hypothetical protein